MKKITLFFAAIALAFAAQAQDTYKVLKINKGTDVVYEIPLADFDSITFETRAIETDPFNGHAYVDLGLPSGTLWATCNVGATSPEEYGDYFAWGETTTKEEYTWNTYKLSNGWAALTKYCNDSARGNEGYTDDLIALEESDDAATANWGGDWRMPTNVEKNELRTECTWTWTTLNGVNGHIVKGKNGNSIFLPATGYRSSKNLIGLGTYGNYWTLSLYEDYPDKSYYLYIDSGEDSQGNGYSSNSDSRYYGFSVRAVCSERPSVEATTYTINVEADATMGSVTGAGTYPIGETVTLTATANEGCVFIGWSDGETENPRSLILTKNVTLTAIFGKIPQIDSSSHSYVDLGLPSGTLWATYNVGATSPEEYGYYFAWGETTTKEDYSRKTLKYWNNDSYTPTKYTSSDGLVTLEAGDDAATANWGDAWRMPTFAEFQELIDECSWTWTTINGVDGYIVSSKINGNTNAIFLPAAGFRENLTLFSTGSVGSYWSSSLEESRQSNAIFLYFESYKYDGYIDLRSNGYSVRPICSNPSSVETDLPKYTISVEVDATMGSVTGAGTYSKDAITMLTATANEGYRFTGWSDGNTENPRAIIVTEDMTLTALFEAIDFNGHAYVDLGLPSGTLWATCNIGATNPEDDGDYFAWGETEAKRNYTWSTYKYCDGSYNTQTKYCTDSNYGKDGFTDNKTILETADDAAIANWGGDWRMPTQEEINELLTRCTWDWTEDYNGTGISGYIISSRAEGNSNSIFLPTAGYYYGTSLTGAEGGYWCSELDENSQSRAHYLFFYDSGFNNDTNVRYFGRSIRPVCSGK